MNPQRLIHILLASGFLILLGFQSVSGQTTDDIARLRDEIIRNEELLTKAKELVQETRSIKARASLHTAVRLHTVSKELLQVQAFFRATRFAKEARQAIFQTIAIAKREAKIEGGATKAIEQAHRRLEQARQILDENRNAPGPPRRLLDESFSQLRRATDNMREHLFETALRLARSSEELANRAIVLMGRGADDPKSIQHALDKTDRILERLRDQLDADSRVPIRRMAAEASQIQRGAKAKFRNGRFRIAQEMTHNARNTAMRALKLLTARAGRENVERAIRLTDALIGEAKEIIESHDAPRLSKRIEHAQEIQSQAKRHFDGNNLDRALRETHRARNILKDALGAIRGTLDTSGVNAALVRTDAVLEKLSAQVGESDNADVMEIYIRARSRQEEAWKDFRAGRLRAALARTKLSRNLARRAARLLNDEDI